MLNNIYMKLKKKRKKREISINRTTESEVHRFNTNFYLSNSAEPHIVMSL